MALIALRRTDLALIGGTVEILPRAKKAGDHIGGLDDIAAVVIGTERDGGTGFAVDPMREGAVIGGDTVG